MSTLLLVEDDDGMRALTKLYLQTAGHTVIEAPSGSEALQKIESDSIDAILLDITLGDMEGMAVLRRVRAKPEMKDLPVLMLSGHASKETMDEASELGCTAYLTKPYQRDALLEIVEKLLA